MRSNEREPADSLRDKSNVIGGWLPSLTSPFGMSMSPDKIISEARARVIWGEPSPAVRDFLISNGVSVGVAAAKLKEFGKGSTHSLVR
jgi:hypothetical protein